VLTLLSLAAAVLVAASLPRWLPAAVIRLRMWIFARINGEETIELPGASADAARFKRVYSHPAANGRSRGAALSDVFWYWLSPGPEIHQEHIEPGERYDKVAASTRRILALPRRAAEELVWNCVARAFDQAPVERAKLVRLRDWAMPIWADFYYHLVFGETCPIVARRLIVDNANDVVTALKCCGLRHMRKRDRLTRYLIAQIEAGRVPHDLPEGLSTREQALYLQGVFFNTAIVQMSEATAHLLFVLAQHAEVQDAVLAGNEDERYLDHVMAETMRLYPLFGIAHRIASTDIVVDERTTIPKGSVVCFNYPEFHRVDWPDPERFQPDRWKETSARDANYIPFGVAGNRPCPAQGIATVTLRVVAREVLQRFALYSSASHARSLPNRGPCLVVPRDRPLGRRLRGAALAFIRVRDRWEDVYRSLAQLVLGSWMIWEARRLRLCERHFAAADRKR
jgi:hypothetical protein